MPTRHEACGNGRAAKHFGIDIFMLTKKRENLIITVLTSIIRRRSSEPSYHPFFGQIFGFEIFNYFDSGHSAQHIVK